MAKAYMQHFNYKQRSLFNGPHLLGVLLVLAGLFALLSPLFFQSSTPQSTITAVGVGALVIGGLIISAYQGTRIDLEQKKVKDYFSVAGLVFGQWQALPPVGQVRVIGVTFKSTNTPNAISPTLSGKVTQFKVLLYEPGARKPFDTFIYSKQAAAQAQGKAIAQALQVPYSTNLEEA